MSTTLTSERDDLITRCFGNSRVFVLDSAQAKWPFESQESNIAVIVLVWHPAELVLQIAHSLTQSPWAEAKEKNEASVMLMGLYVISING